jgi:hypothetical protein
MRCLGFDVHLPAGGIGDLLEQFVELLRANIYADGISVGIPVKLIRSQGRHDTGEASNAIDYQATEASAHNPNTSFWRLRAICSAITAIL